MKNIFILLTTLSFTTMAQQTTVEEGKIIYNFNFHNQTPDGATTPATKTAPATLQPQSVVQPTQPAPQTMPAPSSPVVHAPTSTWGIELGYWSRLGKDFVDPDYNVHSFNNGNGTTLGFIFATAAKNYFHAGYKAQDFTDSSDGYFRAHNCSGFYLGFGKLISLKNSWSIDMALDYSLVSDDELLTISTFQASVGPSYQWDKLNFSLPIYLATNNIPSTSRNDWGEIYYHEPVVAKLETGIGFSVKYLF